MYKNCVVFFFLFKVLFLNISSEKTDESNKGYERTVRDKREIASITIETVVILDEDFVANKRANGHSTNESLHELMTLKWTGVQAEWGREQVLGYDVKIALKEIVIWETNPAWFTPASDLDTTLVRICFGANNQGLWRDFDLIYLYTGGKHPGSSYSGLANVGKVCVDGQKCAVSLETRPTEYYITAHELGHCLGMSHDGDVGCPSPNHGIMGGKTMGWSSCSVASINGLLSISSASCVFETNIAEEVKVNLTEAWPGMVFSDDELCELINGPGYRYKTSSTCSAYRCINLDPMSPAYGISYSHPTPTDGSYCGERMVCSSQIVQGGYKCISWNETDLDLSLFTMVTGQWSSWEPWTSCSRTCGNGIQYRRRICNNPKPQNSKPCEGHEFDIEFCSTEPCPEDSLDKASLILQRASETCSHWKSNNVYEVKGEDSSNYLDTGKRYGNSDDNQCDVKCDTVDGYKAAGNGRHGIIPDGTPCTPSILSSFVEKNNLPRKSGVYGSCILGYCYTFGCDNKVGSKALDGCGVCGGDNSSCQNVEGVYDTILSNRERGTVAVIPANASLIQFYFIYGDMTTHFLELREADTDKAIINYRALNTMNDPVEYADTKWYLLWSKQFLYAHGPTNREVVIKLFNYGSKNNTGVRYAYSMPVQTEPEQNTTTSGVPTSKYSSTREPTDATSNTTTTSTTSTTTITDTIQTDSIRTESATPSTVTNLTYPTKSTTMETKTTTSSAVTDMFVLTVALSTAGSALFLFIIFFVGIKIFFRRRSSRDLKRHAPYVYSSTST